MAGQTSESSLTAFVKEVARLDEVMECYHLTGAYDFILRVVIADMNEYSHVLLKNLSNLQGIQNFISHFVMKDVKHETTYVMSK